MAADKPANNGTPPFSYSRVACIGSGMSAVALGVTLKKWYNSDDIRFFERHPTSGGTWWINSYPGCACDVPSALYSYSFEPNPSWTKLMPSHDEIKAYHDSVVEKYELRKKMVFSTEVLRCEWNEQASLWTIYLKDLNTGRKYTHMCQVLFSAAGQLVEPRKCDIPGRETFKGHIFHSARWDHSVTLKDKKVVVVGNGCTAAQIVPAVLDQTKHLTQVVRSKHWIYPPNNFVYPQLLLWIFKYIPFALYLHRFHVFLLAENGFRLFLMTKGAARLREKQQKVVEKYMRGTAPAKYHDLIIPDFDIGCKRRIFDGGYLASLNSENLTLTDEKILEIVPNGVKTDRGYIDADVIVLATGFQTNEFLHGMEVVGRNGETINEHWSNYPGPEAYNCSVMSGFPNFFFILGPNSATGHTSALMAAENSINYALRILKPMFEGRTKSVEIKPDAEKAYVDKMQEALSDRVWNTGCQSWYLKDNKWNSMAYPWSQAYYWYRSLFPIWSDWNVESPQRRLAPTPKKWILLRLLRVTAHRIHRSTPDLHQLNNLLSRSPHRVIMYGHFQEPPLFYFDPISYVISLNDTRIKRPKPLPTQTQKKLAGAAKHMALSIIHSHKAELWTLSCRQTDCKEAMPHLSKDQRYDDSLRSKG